MENSIKVFNEEAVMSKSNIKRSNIFNEFFWICSGANRHILRQCPTEYSKYFGIGGTIFFTAAMAMLSGGYAFYTIFNSINLAVIFGVFWGLLIFNLDRFIVNTMYSDGKHTISWGEFIAGLPRLVIALFLGIVISTPLEMKIFEDRIESQIVKDNAERTEITRNAANPLYSQLENLNIQLNKLYEERNELEKIYQKASEDLKKEGEGSALSGKAGHGPIYKEKAEYEKKCEESLRQWDNRNAPKIKRLEEDIDIKRKQIADFEDDIEKGVEIKGFCVRYEAFENVKKEVPAVRVVSLFIMMLFIIIEIAPTFFKMMIASGPYDELLREEMERKKAMSITNVSIINDNANTQIQISVERNKAKLEAELLANKTVLSKIAEAQVELIETAIEEWRKEELEKIKANPSQYVKSNTNS